MARSPNVKVKKNYAIQLLRVGARLDETLLPGVEAVGAAYNPFLEYASSESITVQIFDWSKAPTKRVPFNPEYMIPQPVDVQQSDRASFTNTTGQTIDKFQSSLAHTVTMDGSYNFFSGTLTAEYTSQSLTQSEREFTRIQQSVGLWSLRLLVTADLRKYLRDDFLNLLDTLPNTNEAADQFFNTFGSHFLTGIVMGGRAVLSSATNKLEVDRSYSVDVVAEASYKGLTGQLSVEDKTKYSQAMASFNSTSESNNLVVGGDGVKAAAAFDGKEGFKEWAASVGTSPDFVNFVKANPMAGLWRLCKTQEQANFLETYYNVHWAPAQSAKLQLYPDYIDSFVVISDKSSDMNVPTGYTKIPFDLNATVGGDYIYLCYHKGSFDLDKNKPCVTDIKIIYDGDPTPEGFIKLPQDLNAGAGGAYVYFCYKTAPYDNASAIKDVTVIGGKSGDVSPPYDFIKVPSDLNAGAGGDFIYVCYSKEG